MNSFTFVTGNKNKLRELTRMLPADFKLTSQDVDLEEIQSMDLIEIITDKVRRAYEAVQAPVVVEDVSAGLDELKGLPGPFIKFFEIELGKDALYQLAGKEAPATAICTMAYFDGSTLLTATGTTYGTVVPMRADNGFGFDSVFVPQGATKTYSEMDANEKDAVSHRGKAVRDLLQQLKDL